MTEAEALALSTGYFSDGQHVGYLPFRAANFLVGTGRWQFKRVDFWGYIIEPSRTTPKGEPRMNRITNSDILRAQEARIDSLALMLERLTAMHGETLAALTESRKQPASETVKLGRAGTSGNPTVVNVELVRQEGETEGETADRARVVFEALAARFPLPSGATHASPLGPWNGDES